MQWVSFGRPLGFSLEDRQLKRAGLDYWDAVNVRTWDSFAQLQAKQTSNTRYFFLTTKSGRAYYDLKFCEGDFLVFGRETKGFAGEIAGEQHWELPYHPDARDPKSEPSEGSCNCAFRGGATTDVMALHRSVDPGA